MQSTLTTIDRSKQAPAKRRIGFVAAAALAGAFVLASADPAAARNDFANAFERELGRIVAHDVAAAAHLFLPPLPLIVRDVHVRHVRPPIRHHRHFRPHFRPHRVHVHHHYRGCGHKWHGAKWRGDRRHDRWHRHDRFDRRDRYDRRDRRDRFDRRDRRRGRH